MGSNATPLVLLVDSQEASSRSVESILRPAGNVVLKAYTGQQALDLVSKVSPDTIAVDIDLPDMDGIDLIRRLKEAPTVGVTTPILCVSSSTIGRVERLEALDAGAWDILTHPLDPNELILRTATFVRAKQETDRVRDVGLTDPSTGFYNVRGILVKAREIAADAARSGRPVTCVAIGHRAPLAGDGNQPADERLVEAIGAPVAEALRSETRLSDTLGRLGPGEFIVMAAGTDQQGAIRLADRVLAALDRDSREHGFGLTEGHSAQVRAGCYTIDDSGDVAPEDLLLRASLALRKAQAGDGSFRVRSFEA